MNKYLAVIKDSFREALASRVLWVVLVLITLLLLLLAPLTYREELTWRLGDNDVNERLMDVLRQTANSTRPSPAQHVWSKLDKKLQERLSELVIPGVDEEQPNGFEFMGAYGAFRNALNKQIRERDFYDEEAFAKVKMVSAELKDLHEDGIESLTDLEVARFNRLMLEAAFPNLVRTSPSASIQFLYGWLDMGGAVPLRGATLQDNIRSQFVFVLSWVVGPIGLFVAVLVTASIIPQMFDQGSLHLLLSKPVSRSLLFLSRFFGGCAFVLIAAAYLIGGIWLLLGMRFNIWDHKILLSIPIYLFIFAIYYAVSSFAGVYYRSAIVCITLTVFFWCACFLVGLAKVALENSYWAKERLTRVMEVQDELIAVNELGIAYRWDANQSRWDDIFVSSSQDQIRGMMRFSFLSPTVPREFRGIGPAYDTEAERLVGIRPSFPEFQREFVVSQRGEEDGDWDPEPPIDAPMGVFQILRESDGKILLVSSVGLYRLEGDPLAEQKPVELFGFALPLPKAGPFKKASPDDGLVLARPSDAAMNESTGELAVYSRGKLMVLRREESGKYESRVELELEDAGTKPVVLGFGGESLVMAHQDGNVQVLDATSLETIAEFSDEAPNQPRFVYASPDGNRFAIVFHNGRLWLYDPADKAFSRAKVAGQNDIAGASFAENGDLFVVDKTFRVSRYSSDAMKVESRYSPRLGVAGMLYRYLLVPVYTLFPKPGELDKTFQYLLSGKETEAADSSDLSMAQEELNPWAPVWSSALFMIVVLGLSCMYIEWQEF